MPAYFSSRPSFRLSIALALSLILHGGVMVSDAFRRTEPRPPPAAPALQAFLRAVEPPKPAPPPEAPELLLKNTLDPESAEAPETLETQPSPPPLPPERREAPEKPEPAPKALPKKPLPKKPPRERSTHETPRPVERPAPPPDPAESHTAAPQRSEVRQVQRKLSEFVFYPEEARVQGIEGTVYLFIQLNPDCTVEDVRIDGSSGSRLLDKAAEKGAWAMQRLPGCRSGVYPYIFRLVD